MKTSMQELREDLQLTIETAKDALLEIENEDTRVACQEVVRLTLKNIIKRIDDELLEMEKQQQNEFAIGFAMSISTHCYCELGNDTRSYKELLEIYKKEKGL
jgi:hypothetical protein